MARRAVVLMCAGSLAVAAMTVLVLDDGPVPREAPPTSNAASRAPVTVLRVDAGDNAGEVRGYAEVRPRWSVPVVARVGGVLRALEPAAQVGQTVRRGQLLLRLDTTRLQAGVANAEQALAAAELELATQRRRAAVLTRDRSALGKRGGDALALNEPQVAAAESAVAAARAQLAVARLDLEAARVTAPFDAVVTERWVSPGQVVHAGDTLLQLQSHGALDIELRLSERQWQQLPTGELRAELHPVDNPDRVARARLRAGGYRDPATRQHVLHWQVDDTDAGLDLLGAYVRVNLPAAAQADSYAVPVGALTADHQLWRLDDDDRLQPVPVALLLHRGQQAIVRPRSPEDAIPSWRLVAHPQAAFLRGMAVCPHDDAAEATPCTP